MSEENKYWEFLEEFEPSKEVEKEAMKSLRSTASSRRDFLKVLGLGTASAALIASCKRPVEKAIPYFVKPNEITPGKASYYASGYFKENEFASVLVKVRDGRPIKLEANPKSVIAPSGTSGKVQASVLDVYNNVRYKNPTKKGESISWTDADSEITASLKEMADAGKRMALITPTLISPSTQKLIAEFSKAFKAEWLQYDALSMEGYRLANQKSLGTSEIPSYHFDEAECIVSVGCDFLGTWLSPVEFTAQYSKRRDLTDGQKNMSRHYQVEAGMSLTGSNADKRLRVDRSEYGLVLLTIYNHFANKAGLPVVSSQKPSIDLSEVIADLEKHKSHSLVVCGDNDTNYQVVVNAINHLLGSYETTISYDQNYQTYKGSESSVDAVLNNNYAAVLLWDVNPVYNHPKSEAIKKIIEKAELSVSLSGLPDETAELCEYVLPSPGYLENWDDAIYKSGVLTVLQPTIQKIYDNRQAQETLLAWMGNTINWRDYIKSNIQSEFFGKQSKYINEDRFWIGLLKKGEFTFDVPAVKTTFSLDALGTALAKVKTEKATSGISVEFTESINIGSGAGALNPWLMECPDPVYKTTWSNVAAISPALAREKEIRNGNIVQIAGIKVPALVQPGQAEKTISIAVGYGRKAGVPEQLVSGANVFPMIAIKNGQRLYRIYDQILEKTGEFDKLAMTQTHHSMEGRALIREATLEQWQHKPDAGNEMHAEIEHHHTTLYPEYEYKGHHWGMVIDTSKCTGCSACVLACNTENNVPVVGKKEVVNVHEMHWIRIDRYYNGDEENPEVVRQPVMCQHCDNAPCENVCPVAATNHSSEGINQMAYNRCIGTRYCNNNCPYKVRRFNWLDYTGADAIPGNRYDPADMTVDVSRLRHNPDVTVRAKGVIEKCSFCVQRIQEKKLQAKLDGRPLADGDIQTACQQSCSANAIVFGDMNDPNSEVSKLLKNPRNYHLLEEIHTLPSVGYLTKIRNKEGGEILEYENEHDNHVHDSHL